MNKYSTNVNFDEQTAAIHCTKGIDPQEPSAIGPGIGPAAAPPPPITPSLAPVSLLAPPTQTQTANPAFSAVAVSSGPQPASASQRPPVILPPLHYRGLDAAQPSGFQPSLLFQDGKLYPRPIHPVSSFPPLPNLSYFSRRNFRIPNAKRTISPNRYPSVSNFYSSVSTTYSHTITPLHTEADT